MSPSSTVHGDQHGTKYVAFELLLHAAFVADEIWRVMLEPARTPVATFYAFYQRTQSTAVTVKGELS